MPTGEIPLPPTNCPLGNAPPITWCRQHTEGGSSHGMSVSSSGARYIQDWTNDSAGYAGHVEILYGNGFPIERHETGSLPSTMTTVCDASGRVEIEHRTSGAFRTYYDTANHPILVEEDFNFDGVFEDRFTNVYDGDRLVHSYRTLDGHPRDIIRDYSYDERGRVHLVTTDRDGDGEIDDTQQSEWDDLDREIAQITIQHAEEIQRWTWTYEGDHLTVTEITGLDPYRWTDLYDERGRHLGTEFYDPVFDRVDSLATILYDERDREIEYDQDDGADGSIEQRTISEYCN